LQRLVPVNEGRANPLDGGGHAVDCPSSSKSWSRRASAGYASQPSRVLRASARASKASRCSRSWRSSALIWARAPYLSWAWCSSSCRQQTETNKRCTTRNKHEDDRTRKKAMASYLEDMPCRAVVDLQRLVQRSVEQSVVAAQLLRQLLLLLGVSEEGGQRVDALLPRGRCRTARAGGRCETRRPRRHASSPQPPGGRPTV
jgi:hypothetical protein